MEQMNPCKKCKGKGYVARIDDCYYARCRNCTKWQPYEFLGASPAAAIRNWNEANCYKTGGKNEI